MAFKAGQWSGYKPRQKNNVEVPGLGIRSVVYAEPYLCDKSDNCFTCKVPAEECTGGYLGDYKSLKRKHLH